MSYLKADIDNLNTAINLLNEIIPVTTELKKEVFNITGDLARTWDGPACEYFITKLALQQIPLANAETVMRSFKEYAQDTKDDMVRMDNFIDTVLHPLVDMMQSILGDMLGGSK